MSRVNSLKISVYKIDRTIKALELYEDSTKGVMDRAENYRTRSDIREYKVELSHTCK